MSIRILLILAVGLFGCAATAPARRYDPTNVAVARAVGFSLSGFETHEAATLAQASELQRLPQSSMHYYRDKQGKLIYWFADARGCNCILTADERSYSNWRVMEESVPDVPWAAGEPQQLDPYAAGLASDWNLSASRLPATATESGAL